MILDSGERTVHETGFQRDMHKGKGRFDLLPWGAIWELAKHCEEGAEKYGERNVDKGCPQHSFIDSAFRHLAKYTMGMTDENHLRAAFWNIGWALQQEVYRPDMMDIPPMQVVEHVGDVNSIPAEESCGVPLSPDDPRVQKVVDELMRPIELHLPAYGAVSKGIDEKSIQAGKDFKEALVKAANPINPDAVAKDHAEHFWQFRR